MIPLVLLTTFNCYDILSEDQGSEPQRCDPLTRTEGGTERQGAAVLTSTGVESIERRQGFANIKFHQQSKIDLFKLMALVRNTAGAQFTPAGVLKIPLSAAKSPAELIEELRKHVPEVAYLEAVP